MPRGVAKNVKEGGELLVVASHVVDRNAIACYNLTTWAGPWAVRVRAWVVDNGVQEDVEKVRLLSAPHWSVSS